MIGEAFDRQFVEVCEEMIEAWRGLPQPAAIRLPDQSRASWSNVGAAAVVWGWTARVARMAEAALLLHRNGFDVEVAPQLRSMLEHSIAIQWVADKRGAAYQALARERAESWAKFKAAQDTGWKLKGDAADLLEQAVTVETDDDTHSEDTFIHTFHRALEYDLVHVYQGWLVETWGTHATMMSAEPYFDVASDEPTRGKLYRIPQDTSRRTTAIIALALHVTFTGYERLESNAFSGRLEAWERRFETLMAQLVEAGNAQPGD